MRLYCCYRNSRLEMQDSKCKRIQHRTRNRGIRDNARTPTQVTCDQTRHMRIEHSSLRVVTSVTFHHPSAAISSLRGNAAEIWELASSSALRNSVQRLVVVDIRQQCTVYHGEDSVTGMEVPSVQNLRYDWCRYETRRDHTRIIRTTDGVNTEKHKFEIKFAPPTSIPLALRWLYGEAGAGYDQAGEQ